MNFSSLYQAHGAMREPSYELKVGGAALAAAEDARLLRVECELTCGRQAGVLALEALLNPEKEHGAAWLDALQPGVVCSFSIGYGDSPAEVFCGFLYDVSWGDPLDGDAMLLEAVCLDARGRLMLTACADAGARRTLSQLIDDILGQGCCAGLAAKRTVIPPPEDWNLPARRPGSSDYGVLCEAADFLCYEFYAFADELYFGPPRPETGPAVTFDGPNGLIRLSRRRTLAGQCAAVAVSGTDDAGQRIYSRQAREPDSGFGTNQMGGALSGDIHQPEPFARTMAQAQYLSQARMARRQHPGQGRHGQAQLTRGGAFYGDGIPLPAGIRPGPVPAPDRAGGNRAVGSSDSDHPAGRAPVPAQVRHPHRPIRL